MKDHPLKTGKRKPLILRGSCDSGLQRHVSAVTSVGVCLIDNTGVEVRKPGTAAEHVAGVCYFVCVPVGADINGSEAAAAIEHSEHSRYLGSVPVRNVQSGEG